MCGIAGFIDFQGASSEQDLEDMTHALEHRGPDGFGTFIQVGSNYKIGLGHRRLSILELSELGKQPMTWNQLTIVFNGEIYNFKEIKSDLEKLGHSFLAESDTEMILHAYSEWGEKCLDRFIGMFSFVVYDSKSEEIFIARDRAGVKPLFIYQKNGLFLFASELKAFHKHPQFEKKINPKAVHAYLQYGSVPTPHCIFDYCSKLEPGHFIKTSLNNFKSEPTQYWNVYNYYNKPKLAVSIEEAKLKAENLLKSACEYRMVSDVPVGVFLSGGYDSACVTALLQKDRTEALRTFTISVPDIGLNEAPFAKEVAERLQTNHTETECTAREAIDLIAELPYFYDEPFADSSAIPTTLVSKIAKQHVTVALSADGGDEVFAGYNRYEMILKYGEKLNKIPSFARKGLASVMELVSADSIPVLKNKYNFAQRYEKTKSILRDTSDQNIMLSVSQLFTEQQINKISTQKFETLQTYFDSQELTNHSPLAFAQAMDYQTYLLDDILQKVDRASMSVSLESREPLLDHRLIEYVAQLPDDYKIRNGSKKWLLKEIVHQYIPQSMMDRPKMGFAIPIESWLKNELRDLLETYLSEKKVAETGLFNWGEISRLKHSFLEGRKEYGVKIWYLLSYLMWFERWGK
ncbi:asparagine synthase (glutamine-hydrolyzing) [Fluviicola taffensis]|uniref:asparagine synthase (glutamine-hydrolyzing) n=1 Tax=Fluviicola taffensis (strain DSM 16823 / NCIMB 13979 / RW262) TaxID=755732 RepID=F2II40_FLUTR|nr:asparagine synthase (glutamine-hydrolyzing) [Fluviicola taffensis]AEA42740.1 asparagine synthase (glutamine-hydrolyzing) [Fluviicola taffensis DSM 16823]